MPEQENVRRYGPMVTRVLVAIIAAFILYHTLQQPQDFDERLRHIEQKISGMQVKLAEIAGWDIHPKEQLAHNKHVIARLKTLATELRQQRTFFEEVIARSLSRKHQAPSSYDNE